MYAALCGDASRKQSRGAEPGLCRRLRLNAEGGLSAQHDGRFQPPVDGRKRISVYDNRTFSGGAARAVEFTIDEVAG